jgi:hypothetical protein
VPAVHPQEQFAPVVLNAGFARRLPPVVLSRAAAGLEPKLPFLTAPPGEPLRRKPDDQVSFDRPAKDRAAPAQM